MKSNSLSRMVAAEKKKLRAEYEYRLLEAFTFCEQWYADLAQIAAAEAFGLDPDGVKKFVEALADNRIEFANIWNSDTDECEYTMHKVDERLKSVCGPHFIPYEERYTEKVEELKKKWI